MASKDKTKPNIIFMLSDDQGAWAMGYAGNKHIITPNFNKLAAEGMTFTNSFCASPVCSPARATILTGRTPSQHGVQDWIRLGHYGENAIDYLKGYLTYPEVLKENGYECAFSGKWHLGDVYAVKNRFPDHTYVHLKGAGHYYNAPMVKNGELINEPRYISDCIADDSIGYLNEVVNNDNPFYLSVHFTAPHNPWTDGEHPKEITDLYKNCDFDDIPQGVIRPNAIYRYNIEDARECLIGYYSAITAMDRAVGRIMAEVDRLGLRENTIVVFTSDNGFNCGHHGLWGKGNATPELNMYETSIKVPLIVRYPGVIEEGSVSDAMVSQYDYFPTLMDLVGLPFPFTNDEVAGKSFANVLKGETKDGGQHAIAVYDEYGPVRMSRTKEWKYIHRYETGLHELYNLEKDPNEDNNLYGASGTEEITEELRNILFEFYAKYSEKENDGSVQPVRGNGQINKIKFLKEGELAFDQNRRATTDPKGDPSVEAGNVKK